jgi:hypothetical protein
MIDPVKTTQLRERLNEIRGVSEDNESVGVKKPTSPGMFLFIIAARIAFFHFTQVFILEKAGIVPFAWWQSLVIFFGLGAAISLFKKNT